MGDVARNEGSGSDLRNAAMGVGIGFGVGGTLGNTINNIANQTMGGLMDPVPATNAGQPDVGMDSPIPGMVHLKTEEEKNTQDPTDEMAAFNNRLQKLSMMKEAGLLSDADFEAKRQQILSEI